jgi:hypothetical protein
MGRERNYFYANSCSNLYITGKKAEISISLDCKNDLTEGTITQVLENTSDIHINVGSDNNQVDTTYLQTTVYRTSNRQNRVPITRKKDFFKANHSQEETGNYTVNYSYRLTNTINNNQYNMNQDCLSINSPIPNK